MEIRCCKQCGKQFKARKSQIDAGQGHYCSQRCNYDARGRAHLSSPENLSRAAIARRASVAIRGTKHKSGPEHHSWKGGPEVARAKKTARDVAYTREYRKRNPEMMREAKAKRRGLGRLPRGTVKRIGELQRWQCIVCRIDIREKFHLDHIFPIAKGGEHKAENLQLLCPTCNVRKNAKHPVDFMQEKGFLL